MAGTGKFCTLPKKDYFFIQPGKMFRALLGYFLTMLGKGISSQRRDPGNFAEDSRLGNSNKSGQEIFAESGELMKLVGVLHAIDVSRSEQSYFRSGSETNNKFYT